jgi:Tfp pilus assembly PilM family ATPase
MSAMQFMNPPSLFIEIGQTSVKILAGEDGLELPLDRQENGRLTPSSRESLQLSLQGFLKTNSWMPKRRALCAIGARGVSLRRMTLPHAADEELDRLLQLQIECEFPLSPSELAWGSRHVKKDPVSGNGTSQELAVFAVKREVIEEYAEIFSQCGLSPVFTVGAMARTSLCPQQSGPCAMLDIGRSHSELISVDNGVPVSIRMIPWGGANLANAIATQLNIGHDEAEKLILQSDDEAAFRGEVGQKTQLSIQAELKTLAAIVRAHWTGRKLFLSGRCARLNGFSPILSRALGKDAECECIALHPGKGRSATTLGLQRACLDNGNLCLLATQTKKARAAETVAQPSQWRWAVLAVLLALGLLATRYAEAFIQKSRIVKKTAELKAYKEKLPQIERELNFLQYLRTNQPAYLDAILAIANSAPQGTGIESIALNRRGDFSMRGSVRDANQALDLRSKLNASGFFSTVVAEEQTPTPDRQKIIVRISARWNPFAPMDMTLTNFGPAKPKMPGGDMNPGAMQGGPPDSMMPPPGMMPGAMPQRSMMPPGVMPPGAMPPGAMPPGAMPPGGMPSRGAMPPRVRPTPMPMPEGAEPVQMPVMVMPQPQ